MYYVCINLTNNRTAAATEQIGFTAGQLPSLSGNYVNTDALQRVIQRLVQFMARLINTDCDMNIRGAIIWSYYDENPRHYSTCL